MKRENVPPRFIVITVLIVACLALTPLPAFAFSGTRARDYSETWVNGRNWQYPRFGSDCTNFASQSLHSGGYSYMYLGSGSSSAWWVRYRSWYPNGSPNWGFDWSKSWSVANDLYTFLWLDYPGGWPQSQNKYSNTNTALYGDILFYDWNGDGWWDHTAVEASYGDRDPGSGLYGDCVNMHTTDRRHAIWHLAPYNTTPAQTKIQVMHIDSRNL